MFSTFHTVAGTIQQNPIHVDSKWFKEVITITGSVEASLILSDCIIYHHNKYRGFSVDDQKQYGLLTSISKIQRSYNISYKRAKQVLKDLLDQGLIKIHNQGFIYNQKLYTPTDKALDVIYKLQIEIKNSLNSNKIKVESLLAIDQSTFSDRQKTYKDKNKNNNHNNPLKNYNLLKESKPHNAKTVIFDFNKFQLGSIKCEAAILDYFTIKQNEVVNTITFCHSDKLGIVKFNQILNRSSLKKEAKDFKQLVTWAYFEATKNRVIVTGCNLKSECDGMAESQNVKEIFIDSVNTTMHENRISQTLPNTDNQTETILPEITTDTIQAMIDQRKKSQPQISDSQIKNWLSSDNKKIVSQNTQNADISPEKAKPISPIESSYLLTQSNKLYLLETLSKKGVNNATLILKTAKHALDKHPNLNFNNLLDRIIYRLVTLPEKQKQQKLINQELPMKIDSKTANVINTANLKEGTTDKLSKNNKRIISNSSYQHFPIEAELLPRKVVESEEIQEKITEQLNEIEKETTLDCPNKFSLKILIKRLNSVGVRDKKLIRNSAKEIMDEYPEIKFNELLDGMIYRLVALPSKQKQRYKINHSLIAKFSNITNNENLAVIGTMKANQLKSIGINNPRLPQPSDLTIPHADIHLLRQDWASKADQKFYTGILPVSQQLALVAIIDYVKREGITITFEQEIYEWLYHMISNKDYYYSRAKNFRHWCNIAIRQLMQHKLHKPAGFDRWHSRVQASSFLSVKV